MRLPQLSALVAVLAAALALVGCTAASKLPSSGDDPGFMPDGVEPSLPLVCTISTLDVRSFGNVGVTYWLYNALGQLRAYKNDGAWNWDDGGSDIYTYDDAGNTTSRVYEYNTWGAGRWTASYDDAGEPLVVTYEEEDGTVDTVDSYTYDADERLVEYRHDDASSTTGDYCGSDSYDANGQRVLEEEDLLCDGTVDERSTWSYDEAGRTLDREVDDLADDQLTSLATYTYDAHGNVLTHTDLRYYSTGNLEQDFRTTYTYDSADRVLTEWLHGYDAHGNDSAESLVWTYDDVGNVLSEEDDLYDIDGSVWFAEHWEYTYDADGHWLTRDYTRLVHGVLDTASAVVYTYDTRGNLVTEDNGDRCVSIAYGPMGRNTGRYYADTCDAPMTQISAYTWNLQGQMTSQDAYSDGAVFLRDTWAYAPDGTLSAEEEVEQGIVQYRMTWTTKPSTCVVPG